MDMDIEEKGDTYDMIHSASLQLVSGVFGRALTRSAPDAAICTSHPRVLLVVYGCPDILAYWPILLSILPFPC